jgi:hypothetical protein
MACSACNKRKIVRTNSNLLKLSNTAYQNEDFMVVYYIGPSSTVIGSSTNINYGVRVTGAQMLVHKDDYNDALSAGLYSLEEVG